MRHPSNAVLAALLSGCATVTDPDTRRAYDAEIARIGAATTAVVADGCVLRDEIGGDYVLRSASESAGDLAASRASEYLSQQGFVIGTVSVPFICGSVEKFEVDGVMADADADAERLKLPIVRDARLQADAAARKALRRLLVRALNVMPDDDEDEISYPREIELTVEDAALLKRELGASDVWVLLANGGDVSAAKSIGLGVLIGAVTLAASGGTYFGTSVARDGNAFQAALVNLERRELLWMNALPAKPGEAGRGWEEETGQLLFEPFLGETPLLAGRSAPPSAADRPAPPAPPPPAPSAVAGGASPVPVVVASPPDRVPLTAVALPLPTTLVLAVSAELRNRPTETGAILAALAADSSVKPLSFVENAGGLWVLVLTEEGQQGWVRMERAKTAAR